jgi:hypothetical protein
VHCYRHGESFSPLIATTTTTTTIIIINFHTTRVYTCTRPLPP